MKEHRVIVVGAGPAGVRAAEALVAAGIRPIVIDEASRSGGQIYRRQPENFGRLPQALYGTEASKATSVHDTFARITSHIDYRPDTLAWNIYENELHTMSGTAVDAIRFDAIIIASGATDRLLPLPGWTLPGVYTMGASQIALKAQACAIGSAVVFMGTGPLLYLVAYQYMKAGANVVAVLDTSPFSARIAAFGKLSSRPKVLLSGVRYLIALKRRGIRIETGITPDRIEGAEGVTGVSIRTGKGESVRFTCDAVAMGYHLRSETQLADLARCEFAFDTSLRQWLPKADARGRTSQKQIYLAGDGAKAMGADAAENAGALAAYAVLQDLGMTLSAHAQADDTRRMADQVVQRRFQQGIAQAFPFPHKQLAELPDDTLLCRCEAITVGTLRRTVTELGAPEVNRAKALSRVGMGRCQGRYCGLASAEVIAHTSKIPLVQVGRLRGQAPIKPLAIDAMPDESDAKESM